MEGNMFRKGLVIIIIGLFVGMSVVLSSGKIDVDASKTTFNDGNLSGYVNDTSGNPIEGALVRVYFHETYEEDYSDEEGYYHVTNIPICYCLKNVSCSKECYMTEWVLLSIVEDSTYDFILTTTNQPPSEPYIDGEIGWWTVGNVGIEYDFVFMSTDPDGDNIAEYLVNWDDETGDEIITGPFASGESAEESHTWTFAGGFYITVRAKDINGLIGPEGVLPVTVSKKQSIYKSTLFMRFLEQFPNAFPILRQLLEL